MQKGRAHTCFVQYALSVKWNTHFRGHFCAAAFCRGPSWFSSIKNFFFQIKCSMSKTILMDWNSCWSKYFWLICIGDFRLWAFPFKTCVSSSHWHTGFYSFATEQNIAIIGKGKVCQKDLCNQKNVVRKYLHFLEWKVFTSLIVTPSFSSTASSPHYPQTNNPDRNSYP